MAPLRLQKKKCLHKKIQRFPVLNDKSKRLMKKMTRYLEENC